MNRFLLPVLILLWSLLYSWFWNCQRKPHCSAGDYDGVRSTMVAPVVTEGVVDDNVTTMAETTKEDEVRIEVEKLLFTPLDIYFQTAKAGIERNTEIDNFLSTAKEYLAANPDKKLSVVGHTYSDVSDATNDPLSVKRAIILKDMLIKEGFSASQLITSGKGQREPIASNETVEGKARNRRATVRLAE
jgi:outer membrane protein OmpA-like peptidoglycan-associated protein